MPGRKIALREAGNYRSRNSLRKAQPAVEARLHVEEAATAGGEERETDNSQDTRLVATYSIATNRLKKSSDVPRSRWRSRIAMMSRRDQGRGRGRGRVVACPGIAVLADREVVTVGDRVSGEEYGERDLGRAHRWIETGLR